LDEDFGNPEDLTGEEFKPDQTGQVGRWQDRLSAQSREHYNKFGKSTVEIALKKKIKGDTVVPPLGLTVEERKA
jgi:hypothetical protein